MAEIYWNNQRIGCSKNMFLRTEIYVKLTGHDELAICFRALAPHLTEKGPRARWYTQLVNKPGLRFIRTTLLGHMPGWCPNIDAVGPWRPIKMMTDWINKPDKIQISSSLSITGTGHISVEFIYAGPAEQMQISCHNHHTIPKKVGPTRWHAALIIEHAELWWPHTHGTQKLHPVTLKIKQTDYRMGEVGFRRITVNHGTDGQGFALNINGQPIFCRGAVWSSADIVKLPGQVKDYKPWLELAVTAGMNMLRISGITVYESPEFFHLCDQMGIMVWQDLMLANFDYPIQDHDFKAQIEQEIEQLLLDTLSSPALTVLCGGSEIYQQAAMLGLTEKIWKQAFFEISLRAAAQSIRPDIVYVPNTPSGGNMPFHTHAGISHYYGVGAYNLPVTDARRAHVRFVTECLAFANLPENSTLRTDVNFPAHHDPRWKACVPCDNQASWDFEDVRDGYLKQLYEVDPVSLRHQNSALYQHLSRAVIAEIMSDTFAEWRRTQSSCAGGLVFMLQDLMPGLGWGVIDSFGVPKSAWFGLKRTLQSIALLLINEGVNGLEAHCINETPAPINVLFNISCLRAGKTPVINGQHRMQLAPNTTHRVAVTDVFGMFFDTTYTYQFGPPDHDVVIGRLIDEDSEKMVGEAFYFPHGRAQGLHEATVNLDLIQLRIIGCLE